MPMIPYNTSSNNLYYEDMQQDSQRVSRMDYVGGSEFEETYSSSPSLTPSPASSRCSSPSTTTNHQHPPPPQPSSTDGGDENQNCSAPPARQKNMANRDCFVRLASIPPTPTRSSATLAAAEIRRRSLRSAARRNMY